MTAEISTLQKACFESCWEYLKPSTTETVVNSFVFLGAPFVVIIGVVGLLYSMVYTVTPSKAEPLSHRKITHIVIDEEDPFIEQKKDHRLEKCVYSVMYITLSLCLLGTGILFIAAQRNYNLTIAQSEQLMNLCGKNPFQCIPA